MRTPTLRSYSMEETARMRHPLEPDMLTIGDALIMWCAEPRIRRWQEASNALRTFRFERQLSIEHPDPKTLANFDALKALWEVNEKALLDDAARAHWMLESDLRWQLSNETLFAQGFRAGANPGEGRVLLPGAWAGDFKFDPFKSIVAHGTERYLSVAISRQPLPQPTLRIVEAEVAPQPREALAITAETIADLQDEVILKLLEAYLERVACSPDAKLREPGKISMVPFVARRMRHRAATGQLLPTLAAEAESLEKWAKAAIEGHPTPKRKTISKQLGREYLQLRARSNAAIQNVDGATQTPQR